MVLGILCLLFMIFVMPVIGICYIIYRILGCFPSIQEKRKRAEHERQVQFAEYRLRETLKKQEEYKKQQAIYAEAWERIQKNS